MADRGNHFPAPAKVNLYLHITGRRADGYHLLDSLIVFAGVGDTVTVRPADGLSLHIEGPFAAQVPTGRTNLLLCAARELRRMAAVKAGARITLIKRLPLASGIGGGSTDAAAALRALKRLWEVDVDEGTLRDAGLSLGADVPVCLKGRSAFVSGIGEVIRQASHMPPAWLVLANPGMPLKTEAVFAARTGAYSEPAPFTGAADARELAALLAARRNDLTQAAIGLAPPVAEVLEALRSQPGALISRMSGSGATCFALFAEAGEAAAAKRLGEARPAWWVVAAPLLSGTTAAEF